MIYAINDQTLIEEICGDIRTTALDECKKLRKNLLSEGKELPGDFAFPLDEDIVGPNGKLKKLLSDHENTISYSKAKQLDDLWGSLLDKSIVCLRYFDTREPFLNNPNKAIVSYGIDKLKEYHLRYTEFESLMYGSSAYYRDHVFHAIRVWLLGVFCLLKKINAEESFITKLGLDGGAKPPSEIGFFEYISMWTITALCHDLGYPLEKAEQILDKTRKMMREFVPSPNVWNNFGYSGTQDSINEYVLKFISTKMKEKSPVEKVDVNDEQTGTTDEKEYLGSNSAQILS